VRDDLIADIGRRAPALLCMMDARGNVEYVNERWTELLGAAEAELLGRGWMSYVHHDDVDSLVQSFGEALASEELYRGEFRMRHADGAFRWIVVQAEPERDERGAIVRWFGAGNDIDAHRRAMDALQLLAESGASASSASDVDAILEGVTRAALAGLADIAFFDLIGADGWSRRVGAGAAGVPAEAIETTLSFPTKFDQPNPISRAMSEVRLLHLPRIDEAYLMSEIDDPVRRDAWRSVNIRSMIVAPMMVAGRRLGALTMLRTLSDRAFEASDVRVVEEVAGRAAVAVENIRLTEAARRESSAREHQFRSIADSMPLLLWTTSPDGTTDWHNRGWFEYTGEAEDGLPDLGWQTLHPDDVPLTREGWLASTASGKTFEVEHRIRRADGTYRWFLTRATPERDTNGAIVRWYGTGTDVDEARRAQRTLQVFSELGRALSASLEVQATLDAVMHVVVPEFADWAIINLADENGDLRVAAISHRDETKRAALATQLGKVYASGRVTSGAPEALRSGAPLLYESATRADAAKIVTPEVLDVFWDVGFSSVLVAPLIVGTGARGTLNVAMFESMRRFRTDDVDFFQELARRIAPAIANAELFERERLVARSFQDAALPATLPSVPACTFSAIYEAGRAEALIGGDWYDAFSLADGRIVLSIGDVAGSGLQAAVTMANMRQAIRGVAYVHPDPVLMLEAADLALRSESPDRFVTAFVAVIDPIEDSISFTTAGHPPPLLRTPAGEIVALEASGLPLGLREHTGFASVSRALEPGSTLVLYTDGLIESTHDMDEGYRRLYGAIGDPPVLAGGNPAARIRDSVLIEGSRDDVAILCVRYSGVTLERYRVDVRIAAESARFSRRLVAELKRCGYAGDAIVSAEIVLAELIGNLVRHAPGPATFVIDGQRGHVVLHALDDGPGYRFLSRLPTDTLSERGRGLFLISALAEAFNVTLRPSGGSHAFVSFSTVTVDDAQQTRWSQTSAHLHPAG
jgi:PAS domain S-box-containing protein